MTAINDPLLLQLQYVDEAYNLKFWIDEFHHYHKRAKTNKLAYALAKMCACCADRSLTGMVYYREQLEDIGATIPTLHDT